MSQRYYLDGDGDGHHYLIPVEREAEWNEWRNQDFNNEDADYETPSYAISLGCSPTCVTFEKPEVMGKPV